MKKAKKKVVVKEEENQPPVNILTEDQVMRIKQQGLGWITKMRRLLAKERVASKLTKEEGLVNEIQQILNQIKGLINENKFSDVSQQLAVFNNNYVKYFK